jgi:hypothetical protein
VLCPEKEDAICEGGGGADDGACYGGCAPIVGVRGEEVVCYRDETDGRRGKSGPAITLAHATQCSGGRQRIQKDALRLECLIATRKAEQRGEGIPGREEGDDEDRQHCLT